MIQVDFRVKIHGKHCKILEIDVTFRGSAEDSIQCLMFTTYFRLFKTMDPVICDRKLDIPDVPKCSHSQQPLEVIIIETKQNEGFKWA